MRIRFSRWLIVAVALASITANDALADCMPEPEFEEVNFLLTPDIPEFNVDFAIAWTDSAASIFIQPVDAIMLHAELEEQPRDIIIFSDAGQNRLTAFVCTAADGGERSILSISAYSCDDGGGFDIPMGIATNAVGRHFDPYMDLIYVADRGNDRIVILSLSSDGPDACRLDFIGSFGEEILEWPVDVTVSAYRNQSEQDADFYVVDCGHVKNQGELLRFDVDGDYEYSNGYACHAVTGDSVVGLYRPVSVACYPDTLDGSNYIFVTEGADVSITTLVSNTDDPFVMWHVVSLETGSFLDIGGVALDGWGRIFVTNRGAQLIECFGAMFCDKYPKIGEEQDGGGLELVYPANMIIDTYYGFCEALLFESYNRQSGLRSFLIGEDCGSMSRLGGFRRSRAFRRPAEPSTPQLPLIYALHNAYPNPFNSTCKIGFSLPAESRVSIEVFDALGRKVTKLLDKTLPAGEHSVTFDAEGLSSGTYFYKMTAGKFTRTRQIVMVK